MFIRHCRYYGDAGDQLGTYHDGLAFSTYDVNPINNCATAYGGGWWFNDCDNCCLTCAGGNFVWAGLPGDQALSESRMMMKIGY